MRTYRRVMAEDRFRIKTFREAGLNQSEVAVRLGFHKSTVSRELARNVGGRGYRHKQAQSMSRKRQAWRSTPRKLNAELVKTVNRLLALKWSPQQISERLRHEGQVSVCYRS